MKLVRRLLLVAFVLLPHAGVHAQEDVAQQFGPLHLVIPQAWKINGAKRPVEARGPQGEKLLVSVIERPVDGPSDARQLAQGFARGSMATLASKDGLAAVRPVGDFAVPARKAGFSAASEKTRIFGGKTYFIQYLLASPDAVVYLTFEGKGDALPAAQEFDAILGTQKWDD